MSNIAKNEIERAADLIRNGRLVSMPTETVYGLAADATNDKAVARIFEAKCRPQFNPLIVHVANVSMAQRYVDAPAMAQKLANTFWPGPLTIVMPRKRNANISLLVSAGLDTIALRAPDHPVAQALINTTELPLAAPSANKSGTISPTTAEHVRTSLGDRIDLILDGGPCRVGIESTIVKVSADEVFLLRPGGIARDEIERLIDRPLQTLESGSKPDAPGMLDSHYAPRSPLRLNVIAPDEKEAFLGFGPAHRDTDQALNLSEVGDSVEAAANLFAYLRQLDALCLERELTGIAVAPIRGEGLGEAINDRLKRAAAPLIR